MDCCDREVLSYIATTGGISGHLICDLMVEAVEYRFGLVEHLPHKIQWLSDNAPGYIAYETRAFAALIGLDNRITSVFCIIIFTSKRFKRKLT